MGMLSANFEDTLHRALGIANRYHHEFATLEHLLLALSEDQDALAVMGACGVDLAPLRQELSDNQKDDVTGPINPGIGEATPTAGFQRVLQRAAINVQSAGPEEV